MHVSTTSVGTGSVSSQTSRGTGPRRRGVPHQDSALFPSDSSMRTAAALQSLWHAVSMISRGPGVASQALVPRHLAAGLSAPFTASSHDVVLSQTRAASVMTHAIGGPRQSRLRSAPATPDSSNSSGPGPHGRLQDGATHHPQPQPQAAQPAVSYHNGGSAPQHNQQQPFHPPAPCTATQYASSNGNTSGDNVGHQTALAAGRSAPTLQQWHSQPNGSARPSPSRGAQSLIGVVVQHPSAHALHHSQQARTSPSSTHSYSSQAAAQPYVYSNGGSSPAAQHQHQHQHTNGTHLHSQQPYVYGNPASQPTAHSTGYRHDASPNGTAPFQSYGSVQAAGTSSSQPASGSPGVGDPRQGTGPYLPPTPSQQQAASVLVKRGARLGNMPGRSRRSVRMSHNQLQQASSPGTHSPPVAASGPPAAPTVSKPSPGLQPTSSSPPAAPHGYQELPPVSQPAPTHAVTAAKGRGRPRQQTQTALPPEPPPQAPESLPQSSPPAAAHLGQSQPQPARSSRPPPASLQQQQPARISARRGRPRMNIVNRLSGSPGTLPGSPAAHTGGYNGAPLAASPAVQAAVRQFSSSPAAQQEAMPAMQAEEAEVVVQQLLAGTDPIDPLPPSGHSELETAAPPAVESTEERSATRDTSPAASVASVHQEVLGSLHTLAGVDPGVDMNAFIGAGSTKKKSKRSTSRKQSVTSSSSSTAAVTVATSQPAMAAAVEHAAGDAVTEMNETLTGSLPVVESVVEVVEETAVEEVVVHSPEDLDLIKDVYVVNSTTDPETLDKLVSFLKHVAGLQRKREELSSVYPMNYELTRYFACDTEVAHIDVTKQSPVGHGVVNCFSIYCGPNIDFATLTVHPEDAPESVLEGIQSRLWVDVWDEVDQDRLVYERDEETGEVVRVTLPGGKVPLKEPHPVISAFKKFFEDEEIPKVWHNYGFDRHVLSNLGIECAGFGGDTLHMARLHDASRSGRKTYSLESLTSDSEIMRALAGVGKNASKVVQAKTSMKEIFGEYPRLKSGKLGKLKVVPEITELHDKHGPHRPKWIHYSALDAKATWQLREALNIKLIWNLVDRTWNLDPYMYALFGRTDKPPEPHKPAPVQRVHPKRRRQPQALPPLRAPPQNVPTMWDLYKKLWVPFGELLTSLEKRGMPVDQEHLKDAEVKAVAAAKKARDTFIDWVKDFHPDWQYMNTSSGSQIRQLLYPEYIGEISKPRKPDDPAASQSGLAVLAALGYDDSGVGGGAEDSGAKSPEPAAATPKKKTPAKKPVDKGCRVFKVPNPDYGIVKGAKKHKEITLHGVWGPGVPGKLVPEGLTATGAAQVSMRVLRTLAGKVGKAKAALAALLEEEAKELGEEQSAVRAVSVGPSVLDDDMETLAAMHQTATGLDAAAVEEGMVGPSVEGEEALGAEEEPDLTTAQHKAILAKIIYDRDFPKFEQEAKEKGFGKMYAAMAAHLSATEGEREARKQALRACVALEALCEASAIEKLLTAFIKPLQSSDILSEKDGHFRVHCSLNINTETGRLSARRPNMQNQPALEKDLYKIRAAFKASPGKVLVVADYGQLELRLLAHMADCKSMLEAFVMGGDFHSRTAAGMYDYIKKAIADGTVVLENPQPGQKVLKDEYASERRKAKILNFSIAYGKTAHGLAKDFGTTLEEAKDTVNKWYSDRQEVLRWQENTKAQARAMAVQSPPQIPCVYTLLGRTRPLPDILSENWSKKGHAERAAINTPIQGAAADVASSAMVAIEQCPELRALGFQLLMQVHDEVILEGPEEHAARAKELVQQHMANPWLSIMEEERRKAGITWDPVLPDGSARLPLRVELATDCNAAKTWYEAK